MISFSQYRRRVESGERGLQPDPSVPKDARPYQGHRAGFFSRALAAIIDLVFVIAVVFGINLVIALVRLIIERVQGATLPQFGWSVAIGVLLLWLAWTYTWGSTGRSLGMHIMGLKIVGYSGHRVRLPVAALRSAFCLFFPIGLIWVIFSPANRSLQDVVLRTSVVYDWVTELPTIRSGPPPGTE